MSDQTITLSDDFIRQLRLLMTAITGGVVLFMIVLVVLSLSTSSAPSPPEGNLPVILTAIHFALVAVTFPIGLLIFKSMMTSTQMKEQLQKQQWKNVEDRLKTVFLLRTIIWEIGPIFALITLQITITNGAVAEKPLLWVNAITPVMFLILHLLQMPTKQNVKQQLSFFGAWD